jgi:hypothetical protein
MDTNRRAACLFFNLGGCVYLLLWQIWIASGDADPSKLLYPSCR